MSDSPKAVLFDMDGTLIDSEHIWLKAEIEVMKRLGADWGRADQEQLVGGPLERVAAYMVQRSRTHRSMDDVRDLLLGSVVDHMTREPLRWRPGAVDFLAATIEAGIPRALVTASWAVLVKAHLERMRAQIGTEPFTAIVAGDHILNGKPHPEPYLRAAEMIGVAPEECLAIEDSPTGVRSALSAGCVVVAVPDIASIPSDISGVHVIETLQDVTPRGLWIDALGLV